MSNETPVVQKKTTSVPWSVMNDMLRTSQMGDIAKIFLADLQTHETLPPGFNRNIINQTIAQFARFQREVLRCIPENSDQYRSGRAPNRNKLIDISTVIDMMTRIGHEESRHNYEKFLDMLVSILDTVFYSQTHRESIHWDKWKALFLFFAAELKADVNKTPSRLLYRQGELFFNVSPIVNEPKIKDYDTSESNS